MANIANREGNFLDFHIKNRYIFDGSTLSLIIDPGPNPGLTGGPVIDVDDTVPANKYQLRYTLNPTVAEGRSIDITPFKYDPRSIFEFNGTSVTFKEPGAYLIAVNIVFVTNDDPPPSQFFFQIQRSPNNGVFGDEPILNAAAAVNIDLSQTVIGPVFKWGGSACSGVNVFVRMPGTFDFLLAIQPTAPGQIVEFPLQNRLTITKLA
jgi:hypothetical protein